ncbi:MAG: ParM/StbA family protein [Lachnospiraceae bacterium]|nr:ParM/StbA family protein [Lachnospiraceae bacterium]
MDTAKYRTKTELDKPERIRNNGRIPGKWLEALDIGYSAVKLFSPNSICCFPSYARRIDEGFEFMGDAPASSIVYRNLDTDDMWLVGEMAQNIIMSGDTSDSEAALYGRDRYTNAMYRVIAEVSLGIGMRTNKIGGPEKDDEIVIQTGLPERYLGDEYDLKDALSGHHHFALRIGSGDWLTYTFDVKPENIFVMSQPKGSLFSVCINKDGKWHHEAQKYLTSSVLVFDPGFGTLDLFPIVSGTVGEGATYTDLGMRRVLSETSKLIRENYNVEIPVPAMQKYLETGLVRHLNKKSLEVKEYPFGNLLAESSKKVCSEAIDRIISSISLIDYQYMIVTGGTGAAWLAEINERFKNFTTLKILQSNQNDNNLPLIYSNVRGYYLYRFNKLGKGAEG